MRVIDVDLSSPLPPVTLQADERGLMALVRCEGRPVGLAWMHNVRGRVSSDDLEAAIRTQIYAPAAVQPSMVSTEMGPISIVVCTHERPQDLRRCLASLMPLVECGHEVLVVDNAPTSPLTAQVAAGFPARYLCEPRIGLDNARNRGLHAATYPIVAFTDDDVVVDAGWADALAAAFVEPGIGCVTGLVLPIELETEAQVQFEVYCAHRRDFVPRVLSAPRVRPAAAGIAGMGANMALRRDLALQLGGFDPRLDGGTATLSGGDTDMFARVLDTGSRIAYTPDALVWHRHRREPRSLHYCIFGYGVGLYSFLTKRVLEAHDAHALVIAGRWLVGPLVKAVWRRLGGKPVVPLRLLLLEAGGACVGPMRFWHERRRHRLVLRGQGGTEAAPNPDVVLD